MDSRIREFTRDCGPIQARVSGFSQGALRASHDFADQKHAARSHGHLSIHHVFSSLTVSILTLRCAFRFPRQEIVDAPVLLAWVAVPDDMAFEAEFAHRFFELEPEPSMMHP